VTFDRILAAPGPPARTAPTVLRPQEQTRIALVDLLDRLLAGGVVIAGEVTISVADVDLVHVSLRALITSVRDGMFPTVPGWPRP
jgi:hypothetical protein